MASINNKFEVSSDYHTDSKKTMLTLQVSQWNTFDLSMPSVHTNGSGTGWDTAIFISDLSHLTQLRDALIAACHEHDSAILAAEAATPISEGVTG